MKVIFKKEDFITNKCRREHSFDFESIEEIISESKIIIYSDHLLILFVRNFVIKL